MEIFKNFHLRKMSVGQKSLWIFAPPSKLINGGTEPTPSEISRNSPKIKEQFSEISSYFSELNGSVPTSLFLILLILNGISRNDL